MRAFPCWTFTLLLGFMISPGEPSAPSGKDPVLAVAEKMQSFFQGIEDYNSEVEQIYFRDGMEDHRFRFKYFFKKPDKIRVDFIHPYEGLIVYYRRGEQKATLRPFPSFPALKFRLSIDSSILQTPTGQSISQTDMIFFIDFLFRNMAEVPQGENHLRESQDQVEFLFWARDYVKGASAEKYKIFISARNWFPIRIERYSPEGNPIEISIIRNYSFNSHPGDSFFTP